MRVTPAGGRRLSWRVASQAGDAPTATRQAGLTCFRAAVVVAPMLALMLAPGPAHAAGEAEAFARVASLLEDRCGVCHSGAGAENGLRLEADRIYRSAVNVPARSSHMPRVTPGRPQASLLYLKLLPREEGHYRGKRMPFDLDPLTPEEIALVRAWIESFPVQQWGEPPEPETSADRPARTFRDSHLVNLPTTHTLGAGRYRFRILHRFKQDAGDADLDDLFGLDGGAWTSLGLAAGIGKRWEAGLRHSNFQKHDEGYFKVALLRQESGAPLSVAYHGSVSHLRETGRQNRTRLGAQLLIARRFGQRLSLLLAPTHVSHTQFLDARDRSGTTALGVGAELRFHRVMAITGEWVGQLDGIEAPYESVSIGFGITTARHGFHLIATNTPGMQTSLYAIGGDLDAGDGDFRLGFNISRIYGKR